MHKVVSLILTNSGMCRFSATRRCYRAESREEGLCRGLNLQARNNKIILMKGSESEWANPQFTTLADFPSNDYVLNVLIEQTGKEL